MKICDQCKEEKPEDRIGFNGICDDCFEHNKWHPKQEPKNPAGCRLFEFGHENPADPHGSTAHVRDIKARRLDVKTGQMYYDTPKKTFFVPK